MLHQDSPQIQTSISPSSGIFFGAGYRVFPSLPSWWMMKSTPTCKAEAAESRWLVRHALMIHSFGDNLGVWIVFGLSMIEYFGIRISYNYNKLDTLKLLIFTSSTAQGGGGSFKNRKPIGEIGCCESGMAERIHWWTERCLRSFFLFLWLSTYLPAYLLCIYLSIDLSISLSFSLSLFI